MDIQEKELLESFIELILKKNKMAKRCLEDIEKEDRDIALDYCLKSIENISLSILEYLDDRNCYKNY